MIYLYNFSFYDPLLYGQSVNFVQKMIIDSFSLKNLPRVEPKIKQFAFEGNYPSFEKFLHNQNVLFYDSTVTLYGHF